MNTGVQPAALVEYMAPMGRMPYTHRLTDDEAERLAYIEGTATERRMLAVVNHTMRLFDELASDHQRAEERADEAERAQEASGNDLSEQRDSVNAAVTSLEQKAKELREALDGIDNQAKHIRSAVAN